MKNLVSTLAILIVLILGFNVHATCNDGEQQCTTGFNARPQVCVDGEWEWKIGYSGPCYITYGNYCVEADGHAYCGCNNGTYTGDITIDSSLDLYMLFQNGYDTITGELEVTGNFSNLEKLQCIENVGTYNMHDITGVRHPGDAFMRLETATKIYIHDTSFQDVYMNDLSEVNRIEVTNNDYLWKTEFEELTTVNYDLFFDYNDLLSWVDCSALTEIGDDFRFKDNDTASGTNLYFDSLETVGDAFIVRDNANLEDLDMFSSVTEIGGVFKFFLNPDLPTCDICDLEDQLTTGPGTKTIYYNEADTCGYAYVYNCP